jgi:hypothetical protein
VFPAVALSLAALPGVTGCSQFDKALGQQQAMVSFNDGTPVPVRLHVRAACGKLPDVVAAEPPARSALGPRVRKSPESTCR